MTSNNRRCGDCQLCCKLLPTPEIGSLAGERCQHQKHGVGCAIYARRPASCSLWTCGWLGQNLDMPRPDRAHFVIDVMPDYITLRPNDGGPDQNIAVVQVWVDPQHRDAHRLPALRKWLNDQRMPAVVRYDEREGFVLFPPSMSTDGEWHEERSAMREHSHTLEQKVAALGGTMRVEATLESGGAMYEVAMEVDGKTHRIAAMPPDTDVARAALADARRMIDERHRYPETQHARDCLYVTSDGPAPCTCPAAAHQERKS